MPSSTLVLSSNQLNRSLPERALHLQFDEAVQFDGVLDGQLFRDRLDEAGDDHLLCVVVVQPTGLEVEDVLVADLPDGRLVSDVDLRLLDLHVRHRVRRGVVVEHQRVTLDGRRGVLGPVGDVDQPAVVRAAAVFRDGLRFDGRLRVGRVVVDLRAGVDVLALAGHGDGDVVVRRARSLQDGRGVQHSGLRAHAARDPLHRALFLADSALGVEVIGVFRPVLHGRVLDVGVLADEHFDATTVEVERGVLRRGTALDVVDLGVVLSDDERVLELAHPFAVHTEVRLHGHVDRGIFGDVDEGTAGPDGAVKRGELVVARGDTLRHEVFFDELFVLLDGLVHVTEDDAFLLPAFLHVLVDDLRFVLGADAREGVLLGFRNAQLVESVLNLLWEVLPVLRAAACLNVGTDVGDNLVDIDFREVRRAGPALWHRHLLELLQRAQTALKHPLWFVLVFRDDPDSLLGEALLSLEGGLLLLLELEAGFGVGLFEMVLV